MRTAVVASVAVVLTFSTPSEAQVYPPGTFSVDGIPVTCGDATIILDTNLPDVGMAGHGLIYLNPSYFEGLHTALRLWWVGHECAHHVVGPDETAADCWSVRAGRDEGWFPPDAFRGLSQMFADNPGDAEHLPGPDRVRNMQACYRS